MTKSQLQLLTFMASKKNWIWKPEIINAGHSEVDFNHLLERGWFDLYETSTSYRVKADLLELVEVLNQPAWKSGVVILGGMLLYATLAFYVVYILVNK